jgi:hypothetical protein
MKIIKILLITIAIAFSTNSFSDEHKPGVYIRGNVSCGDWVTSRADEDKHWATVGAYTSWEIGFLSGMALKTQVDILRNIDYKQVQLWLDNYCKEHPLYGTYEALLLLFEELKKRMQ